ncbi:sulfurtransferase [Paenibacillus profundus]|uniref:Sulfurtransferase n=1 Tax=Paenibacillus profundus TaxID=1173085 RepID=A0ABS8YLX6_9BACL|nr:sulfurtransferase [Paenibacillus profundus]MCE5172184.1 sulfurtransferase [Paenibacillus profundus]
MKQQTWMISFEEVQALLGQARVIIADCRFWLAEPERGHAAYEEGHLPGAIYFNLDHDLSSPVGAHGGRHPLPSPEMLSKRLGERGIDRDTTVIVYDDQGGAMASRLWWLLQYVGHQGIVKVMDGGYSDWAKLGYPISTEQPSPAARIYEPHVRPDLVMHMKDVRERLGRPGVVLIDSREPARYAGESESIDPKAGHIPGAVNHFWRYGVDETSGRWKAVGSQREAWDRLVKEANEIIVYCGSGVTACPNVLSLWQSGYPRVKLYAGSWSDWISYEENPIAVGEEEKA